MNRELALAWAAELESGHHKKGRNALVRADGAKCCLGVAQWMIGPVSPYASWPDTVTRRAFGLYNRSGARKDGKSIHIQGYGDFESLGYANDSGVPFRNIAAYIRENWEYL